MATIMNRVPKQQPKPRAGSRVATLAPLPSGEMNAAVGPGVSFLLVSVLASGCQSVKFFSLVPEGFKPLLGDPPSAQWVSWALAIYFLSMLVINAYGLCVGGRPGSLWIHVACRSAFYLLYFMADALAANLPAVLLAGSILLAMEFLWLRANQRRASWGHF
jgi:hypothetical protein